MFALTVVAQNAPRATEPGGEDRLGVRVMELQARYLVGLNELTSGVRAAAGEGSRQTAPAGSAAPAGAAPGAESPVDASGTARAAEPQSTDVPAPSAPSDPSAPSGPSAPSAPASSADSSDADRGPSGEPTPEDRDGHASDALAENRQVRDAAAALNTGSVGQRLRFVALASELGGPRRGLEALRTLRQDLREADRTLSPTESETLELLARVLQEQAEYPTIPPSASDRAALHEALGWFGDLVANPRSLGDTPERTAVVGPAVRLMWAFAAAVVGGAILCVGGLAGLVAMTVLVASGARRLAFSVGSPRPLVYVETFAVWLLLFTLVSQGADLVLGNAYPMSGALFAFAASTLAVAWPWLRGVPWRTARIAMGLHAGRGVVIEALSGAAAYAMTLPLLAAGIGLMLLLMWLFGLLPAAQEGTKFGANDTPAHPLIELIADGGSGARLGAFILACVAAPLIEETLFRGVLYRHLRELTGRAGRVLSVIASMLVTAFVFAAIHPQGLITVPVLMALACGFTLAREWRDSLIAPMVAHAINNGVVVALLLTAFG